MSARPDLTVFPGVRARARRLLCLSGLAVSAASCAAEPDGATVVGHADGADAAPANGLDASVPDGGAASYSDAATSLDAAAETRDAGTTGTGMGCALGGAGSFATDADLDLFGDVVYFAMGQNLPAGRYRVAYEDGCMKYSSTQPWTIQQDLGSGPSGWWLVGASTADRVALLPGSALQFVLLGGFTNFADCVAANKQLPASEFDFAGGKLGVWLDDSPYSDNQAGEAGHNPKWNLTLLVNECPPDLVLR